MAAQGRCDFDLLSRWMTDPYFARKPPKSTGREYFGVQKGQLLYEEGLGLGLTAQDIITTLTAFTARSICDSYRRFLPRLPDEALICGGGAYNPVLMDFIGRELPGCRVMTCDEAGLPSQAKESIAFAILAYETMHRRPGNLCSATGASCPVVLGSITWGS